MLIFTDGACLGNPGPGGWAALLIAKNGTETAVSGHEAHTTNNRMELQGALAGLRTAQTLTDACTLTTDSLYVKQGITLWIHKWQRNGWKSAAGQPVKNQDLWVALLEAQSALAVEWSWVRGHSGHSENERVDLLAQNAARKLGC